MALKGQRLVAVVEARMTSSRLPGKVLMPAMGEPLLQILLERLNRVERIDEIVVATTVNDTDEPIVKLVESLGFSIFRGSEDDVLQRVSNCLKDSNAELCLEVTGDCPLVDPEIIDELLDAYQDDFFYMSNSDPQRSVPAGLDVQLFDVEALYTIDNNSVDHEDREHVSYGFYRVESESVWNPYFVTHPRAKNGVNMIVTLDYKEDYQLIRSLHEALYPINPNYGVEDIIAWVQVNESLHRACLNVRNL